MLSTVIKGPPERIRTRSPTLRRGTDASAAAKFSGSARVERGCVCAVLRVAVSASIEHDTAKTFHLETFRHMTLSAIDHDRRHCYIGDRAVACRGLPVLGHDCPNSRHGCALGGPRAIDVRLGPCSRYAVGGWGGCGG